MILLYYIWKPAPILDRDLWPTVGHLVPTIATRGRFKYGLGGRLTLMLLVANLANTK